MFRYTACLAATLLIGAPLWAGELDGEYGTKVPTVPAAKPKSPATSAAVAGTGNLTADAKATATGSELDGETPSQASRGHHGWGGGHHGWGGGWGRGWGHGWYGWGRGWSHGWRGYGWAGYGWRSRGWGGYSYAPYFSYYPSYVSYGYYGYPSWGYCW